MNNSTIVDNGSLVIKAIDSADYSNSSKYTKLGDSDIWYTLSSLTQFIPEVANTEILSSAYSVTLPNGVIGILTEAKNGSGLIPILRNPATGEFTGQARLHDLTTIATLSGVTTGLSIVTSQYYLRQINQKLSDIQTKLDRVLDFLYTDKLCEIYAESQVVLGIYRNYKSIVLNDALRSASLTTIQHSRIISEKNIQFYYRDMNKIASADAKSASKQEKLARDITDDLNGYNQALSLFSLCCFLEVTLSQNYDKSYLEYMLGLISNLNMNHDIIISKIQGKLDAIAENAVGLISKKASPELIDAIGNLESMIGDESPVKAFEDLMNRLIEDTTTKSEFILMPDGTVYKKRIA